MNRITTTKKQLGVLIGGSGLIGGTLVNFFKANTPDTIEIRAPSSKKLSIRSEDDIRGYLKEVNPDFLINTAITNLNSSSQLAFEVNYIGALNLARAAAALHIPYIHITTAAALPYGTNLTDEDTLPVTANLNNYAKSKLMAEKTLAHMRETAGLDYSSIRLAIAYGNHDHKIQGFHRLLFTIADRSMPFLFTEKGVTHSYSNSRKLPHLVYHMLKNRDEFSGQTYNFADPAPVELASLIITIRDHLNLKTPREIYFPYTFAKSGKRFINIFLRVFAKMGLIAAMPQELMFLESFYKTQTLSTEKLKQSSFQDPLPNETIFSRLPDMTNYYLTRWSQQNLLANSRTPLSKQLDFDRYFHKDPLKLLEKIHSNSTTPFFETTTNQKDSKQPRSEFTRHRELEKKGHLGTGTNY